jgi:hypothetical protein
MDGRCRTHGEYEKCTQNFSQKPEEKSPLGAPSRRRKDSIESKKCDAEGADCIQQFKDGA